MPEERLMTKKTQILLIKMKIWPTGGGAEPTDDKSYIIEGG